MIHRRSCWCALYGVQCSLVPTLSSLLSPCLEGGRRQLRWETAPEETPSQCRKISFTKRREVGVQSSPQPPETEREREGGSGWSEILTSWSTSSPPPPSPITTTTSPSPSHTTTKPTSPSPSSSKSLPLPLLLLWTPSVLSPPTPHHSEKTEPS